jgi:hypothetical protein
MTLRPLRLEGKPVCTDLANDQAPGGTAAQVTITVDAFKRWMERMHYSDIDSNNPSQVVVKLVTRDSITETSGNKTITYQPNWHLTAMTDRMKTRCINFHFKIEASKAAAHYWHYVLYRNANNVWSWVGDPNPNNAATNQGGGGAAGDQQALANNLAQVSTTARLHDLDNKVTRKLQARMVKALAGLNLVLNASGYYS